MLKKIAIVVVVAIAAFLAFAATKPDTFQVQRSTVIKAPPDKIFALIQDFHHWGVWSPYEKRDPDMKRTYGGPESGKGSMYAWEGNSKVGAGRMEILDATAPSKVTIKLDFIKPFESTSATEFTFKPAAVNGTAVTWTMSGRQGFMQKAFCMFMDMDAMVGKDFEKGLAQMKKAAEAMR